MRLAYLTFLTKPTGHRKIICYAHDSGFYICVALGCLALPSIFIGYLTKDMMVGVGSQFFGTSIYVNLTNFNIFDAEFISTFYKTLPVNLSLLGFFSALVLYTYQKKILFYIKISFFGKKIYNFLNRKWFFDKIYNEFFSQFFFKFGFSISYKFVDRGIFEMIGPTGLSTVALKVSHSLHKMQTGFIYHYTLLILIGITVLIGVRQLCVLVDYLVDYRLFALTFVLFLFLLNTKKENEA
jgi:NADH-ubiquinone oxidoreductase chain 5